MKIVAFWMFSNVAKQQQKKQKTDTDFYTGYFFQTPMESVDFSICPKTDKTIDRNDDYLGEKKFQFFTFIWVE